MIRPPVFCLITHTHDSLSLLPVMAALKLLDVPWNTLLTKEPSLSP